jgi:hypothetical protein
MTLAQSLTSPIQIPATPDVQAFLAKWQHVGAYMAQLNQQAAGELMNVMMDPSSFPPNMAAMGDASEEVKNFVTDYYKLAQSMDASNVPADKKIAFLQDMFDGPSVSIDFKSKRDMRYGMRERKE